MAPGAGSPGARGSGAGREAEPARPSDEGVVKFDSRHEWGPSPDAAPVAEIERQRERLHAAGLVGATPSGVGYGNLSVRVGTGFVITGTGTGAWPHLDAEQYTQVVASDERDNRVVSRGPVVPSSESMTHAVIYRLAPEVRAVAHVHHGELWRRALGRVPTTRAAVPYGTPAMAGEVARLLGDGGARVRGLLAMAGHEEGLVAFGSSMQQAVAGIFALAVELGVPLGFGP